MKTTEGVLLEHATITVQDGIVTIKMPADVVADIAEAIRHEMVKSAPTDPREIDLIGKLDRIIIEGRTARG